jgi:hypothetical protein
MLFCKVLVVFYNSLLVGSAFNLVIAESSTKDLPLTLSTLVDKASVTAACDIILTVDDPVAYTGVIGCTA